MSEFLLARLSKVFKLIAIRTLEPTSEECNQTIRTTIVQSMQKSLTGKDDWHYFCNGTVIDDKKKIIAIHHQSLDDQMLFKGQETNVCIGAIVGKNGSGKSTLVDLAIRMMNNVAAVIFGEKPRFAAAEHLHFIDYVFGELVYLKDSEVVRLTMRNRSIEMRLYSKPKPDGAYYLFQETGEPVEITKNVDGNMEVPLAGTNQVEVLQKHFFYTVVCNYSFYAYNYRDYVYEQTNNNRIWAITEGESVEKNEDKYWISGVFHKNDGYQTPIVLNPWRSNGNLDVAKENDLAMERIISLLFYKDEVTKQYPFRSILDKLSIKYIKVPERGWKPFEREEMVNSLFGTSKAYGQLSKNLDEWLYDLIIETWREFFFIGDIDNNDINQDAKDYVVYKTLKICSHYVGYLDIMREMMKADADREKIKNRMDDLGSDRTHITSKLRRACYQLRYGFYQYQETTDRGLAVEDIDQWMNKVIEEHNDEEEGIALTYDDLLPPPLFDFNLGIEDKNGRVVPFTGLSTGERQATYVISNMMYHLVNINSAWNDPVGSHEVKYRYVNMMLDEVELYFHPDLQRKFVDMVLSAIRSVELPHILGVNITLVTHSPFVISDLPDTNIMYLGGDYLKERTFGANIYDLLDNTFFMDDSIGELAKKRIEMFVNTYNKQLAAWRDDDMKGLDRSIDADALTDFVANRYFYTYIGSIIGDDYMRKEMNDMIGELYDFYHRKGVME